MNICDLRTLTWRTIETTGEAPTPQYGQAVVLDGTTRSFYVIGGTTGYDYSMVSAKYCIMSTYMSRTQMHTRICHVHYTNQSLS